MLDQSLIFYGRGKPKIPVYIDDVEAMLFFQVAEVFTNGAPIKFHFFQCRTGQQKGVYGRGTRATA